MDLPTCPACGQSVLDDDATMCPFCGASMSGKPGKPSAPTGSKSAPAKPKPAAAAPKPQAPVAKSAAGKPAPAKKKPAEDDPFDVSGADVRQAIPASPKPAKGKSLKVTCPMCETVGYVPTSAAGKNVKCPNPECLVPIFAAPQVQKAVIPEEPKPESKGKGQLIAAGAVAAVLLLGGLYYMFGMSDSGGGDGMSKGIITDADIRKRAPTVDEDGDATSDAKNTRPDKPEQPTALTAANIQQQALTAMVAASQQSQLNRSKHYCRRLTAEAYALLGDLPEARHQIERLESVGSTVPYYQIVPLAAVAWKELGAGNSDQAAKALDQAVATSSGLPQVGRNTIDTATELAAALVAVGRLDEAVSLIRKHQSAEMVGRESAALQIASETGTFDLDRPLIDRELMGWESPQWVAVTVTLVSHDQWDPALAWARRAPDLRVQSDCLAQWADALTKHLYSTNQQADLAARLQSAAKQAGPADEARMFARAARQQLALGDKPAAEQSLSEAVRLLGEIKPPVPYQVPKTLKGLYESELPEFQRLAVEARASIEIARAQAELGQQDRAKESIARGMAFARATAPSLSAIQSRVSAVEDNFNGVQRELQTELKLGSADEARRKAIDYRQKLREIAAAANNRLQLQVSLYRNVAEGGLLDSIWKEIKSQQEATDLAERELFFTTLLPDDLISEALSANNKALAKSIADQVRSERSSGDITHQLGRATSELIESGDTAKAADMLQKNAADKYWKSLWAMRLTCQLVKADKTREAMDFAREFKDPILREDLLFITGALATRLGHGETVLVSAKDMRLPPTEVVSAYRGIIGALAAQSRSKQGAAPVSPVATSGD